MQNFMVAELVGGARAIVAFAIVLFAPGYVLGWAANLLQFRQRSAVERVLWSTVLSVACVPVLAVLVGRIFSLAVALALFLALACLCVFLIAKELLAKRSGPRSSLQTSTWIAVAMVAIWAVFAVFELVDLQLGERLYISVTAFDHSVRSALVEAVLRSGVPPTNPLYFPGQAVVMRYFYYWYVVCAMVAKLAGTSGRPALIASSAWCGFALASIIPLYLKYFLKEKSGLRRKSVIGIALLLVTGLDILPTAMLATRHVFTADMEWWDPNQITSWMDSLLWVPHHVAALVACLTGFLVLWTLARKAKFRERALAVAIAAAAFASAAGLSVYVTLAFALFVFIWILMVWWEGNLTEVVTFVAAGVAAVMISLPYLMELRGASDPHTLKFALRSYPPAQDWLKSIGLNSRLLLKASRYPAMAFIYVVELGFFLLVGLRRYKNDRAASTPLPRSQKAAWTMLGSAMFVMTFIRSEVISNNDLGFRSALVAQFVLLLWAAVLIEDFWQRRTNWTALGLARRPAVPLPLAATLLLGVVGTLYQVTMLRAYPMLVEAQKILRSEDFLLGTKLIGERSHELRQVFEVLNRQVPADAIVQYDSVASSYVELLLFSNHQTATGVPECGNAFGGDPKQCAPIKECMMALFQPETAIRDLDLDAMCNALSIDVLVANDRDKVWHDPQSWVWRRQPLVANRFARAIACGDHTRVKEAFDWHQGSVRAAAK